MLHTKHKVKQGLTNVVQLQLFTSCLNRKNSESRFQGRTQRLKKGGGPGHRYRVGLVRPCGARSAPIFFRKRIMHNMLGRSGGMLLCRYESDSEAVGDHHNHAKCLTTGL